MRKNALKLSLYFYLLMKKPLGRYFLLLNREALDVALELEEEVKSGKDGVRSIIVHLDKFYKKDDTLSKFHALCFISEKHNRPSTLSITLSVH